MTTVQMTRSPKALKHSPRPPNATLEFRCHLQREVGLWGEVGKVVRTQHWLPKSYQSCQSSPELIPEGRYLDSEI